MPLEKLYVRSDLREYYKRMLLEDARRDLKAQSIVESEYNYPPEMNGHVVEIIVQVKKEVLHILGFIKSLEKFEDIRKRYQNNFKTALTDLHNNKDTFVYEQLNVKKQFVSDLSESNFHRLLQHVRVVMDKLFDDKKQELQQQGEK